MRRMLKAKPTIRATSRQRPTTYGGSCLPMTMELARLAKPVLLGTMASPSEWGFEDRVLVLLAPSMRADIEQFRSGAAASMDDMFEPHQVERFDQSFVAQLFEIVTRLSPELAARIVAGSSPG
ncbi:MAG: hypothetical protein JWM10_2202 [Myxococcaceae bacterium]|nr:hypothetical protein [Myxococcaceae bacterium]